MAYRCKTHESKECDGCGECQERGRTKKIYGVTIILDMIEVEAEDEEEAKEKAQEIYESDLHTHLEYGLSVVDYNVELLDEEEE